MKNKHLLATALLAFAGAGHAHSGHGALQAAHWHASDTAGLLTIAVLAAIALWMARDE